ncbi:MAG: DUF2061 domain-containing protein [Candidatus Bathyarchaeota archaeon]
MRSALKSISFRLVATLTTIALILAFTKNLVISFEIGIIEFFGKRLLYYLHERLWNKSQLGRNNRT